MELNQDKRENQWDQNNFAEGCYAPVIRLGLFGEAKNEKSLNLQLFMKVVAGGGIEPPTQGFSVLCSTN
jgi:hypothetical protein